MPPNDYFLNSVKIKKMFEHIPVFMKFTLTFKD